MYQYVWGPQAEMPAGRASNSHPGLAEQSAPSHHGPVAASAERERPRLGRSR
jgi:hypothetical protein